MGKISVRKLVLTAFFIALAMVLPFLIGQIPEIGSKLSPMHIPALLCGFVCGWPYGLVVGFISPLLRSLVFGMPPLFPTATAMAFEMAVYGAISGIAYAKLPKNIISVYISLIVAMLAGRVIWGITMAVIAGANFSWAVFVAQAFVNAIPGIILHIVLVPLIILALRRAKLMGNEA